MFLCFAGMGRGYLMLLQVKETFEEDKKKREDEFEKAGL